MTNDDLIASKIKNYNNLEGNLGEVDCKICKNKGFVAVAKDGIMVTKECECMAQRRSIKRMRKSGLIGLLDIYTFDSYQTPEKWHESAKERAERYVADGQGKWFVITGTPGTGKTHICTAIAGGLMHKGQEVRYMLWRNEAPRLKAIVNEREEYERELNKLKKVDVLYIDDFFKGSVSDADINLAFELLNDRYNDWKSMTIISSEKTIEQMLDVDEAIGSRIYERSKGYCIKAPNKNWRLR